MPRTALVLGANGRFGRNIAGSLARRGWTIRRFNRKTDGLPDAALGCDLIVNAWNPPYSRWATEVPALTRAVIGAARSSGATVMIPGNIYVYGADLPTVLSPDTPHRASNPLGRIRREMEASYREAGVKTVILRAGDYLDTAASGNWFDKVIAAKLSGGRMIYPGPLDRQHAWAFLPDLTEAGARLADRLDGLDAFSDLTFGGYALTGSELAGAMKAATGQTLHLRSMNWIPVQVARPFWREAAYLLEMRYLWQRPHRIDGRALAARVPDFTPTPLVDALRQATAPLL